VAFIREHAADYGVDPNFIAVTGGSAGGHLTTMMALTANQPEYQPGIEDADTSLQAAVPFYGVYDFTNRNETMPPEFVRMFLEPLIMKRFIDDEPDEFSKASPLDQIHAGAPPFFVIHGDNDTLAPVEDAREFVALLSEVSHQPVYYLELKGAQHAFDVFSSMRSRRVVRAVHRFLVATHHNYLAGRPTAEVPAEVLDTEAVNVDDPDVVERVS
jgi:acetyl esterase/lipase